MWEISGFVRAAWSVLRMTEASETTKWSLEVDNILCVCTSVWWCMCACAPSWASFESVCARHRPGMCAPVQYTCGWYFFLSCCASVCVCVSVCVPSCQRHDRRERWFSLAVVASESAREPTGSKWYSLVLNARVGRPALLQPPVSCYIMTWRWRGTTLLRREERERRGGAGRAGEEMAAAEVIQSNNPQFALPCAFLTNRHTFTLCRYFKNFLSILSL